MVTHIGRLALAIAVACIIGAVALSFVRTPGETAARATIVPPPAPSSTIGQSAATPPPPIQPQVQAGPSGTASSGPQETGPHGQVDVTKPMPAVPATAPRVEPDRPVADKSARPQP